MKIFRDLAWIQTQNRPTGFYLLVKMKSIQKREDLPSSEPLREPGKKVTCLSQDWPRPDRSPGVSHFLLLQSVWL